MIISFEGEFSENYKVNLSGEFDALGCKEIREQLEGVVDRCGERTLALDLKDVSFIDSSGVGAIVFLFKRLRAVKGYLTLVNVQGQPLELLTLLRVDEAIPVKPFFENDVQSEA